MGRPKDQDLLCPPQPDGRYMLSNITARRARQINRERTQSQFDESMFDALDYALTEYRGNKIRYTMEAVIAGQAPEDFRAADG